MVIEYILIVKHWPTLKGLLIVFDRNILVFVMAGLVKLSMSNIEWYVQLTHDYPSHLITTYLSSYYLEEFHCKDFSLNGMFTKIDHAQ